MKSYKNFRLELSNYKPSDGSTSFTVRVLGEQYSDDAVEVKIPGQLAEQHSMLQRRELDLEKMIEFGENLAKLLLPPIVRQKYYLSRAKLKSEEGLRIQICTKVPKLAALPWEYIYVWASDGSVESTRHAGFLALDREISIVRYQILEDRKDPEVKKVGPGAEVVRIGALLSDGREAGHQELDMVREKNNLEQALIGVGVELETFPEGKLGGVLDWLTENNSQVFHFAGHGTIEKEPLAKAFTFREEKNLVLVGEDGGEQLWDDEKVAMALSDRGIRLVVLSACDSGGVGPDNQLSGGVPALVQNGIPAVVGMQFTVRDANAIAFSHQFYLALASGKSVDTAVSEGRQAIFQRPIESGRDWGVPVLYLQTDQVLFPKPTGPLLINLCLLFLSFSVLGIWFFLHIFPLWNQTVDKFALQVGLGVGAIPAIWAFFQLIGVKLLSLVRPREQNSLWERLLHHRYARKFLVFLSVSAAALALTTNSIYLTAPTGTDPFEIDLQTTQGDAVFKLFRTLKGETNLGRPVFFKFKRDIKLELKTPGWALDNSPQSISNIEVESDKPGPVELAFWKSARVSLSVTPLKIMLLAPDYMLTGSLPDRSAFNPGSLVNLKVTVGDTTAEIKDLRQGIVFVGAPQIRLKREISTMNKSELQAILEECVTQGSGAEGIKIMKDSWLSNYDFLETELKVDDDIVIKVQQGDWILWDHPVKYLPSLSDGRFFTECLSDES